MPITPVQLPNGTIVNIDHAENAEQSAILQLARSYYDGLSEESEPEVRYGSPFRKGASRGVDTLQLGYSSALEGIGKVTGIEPLEEYGAESVEAQEEQLAEAEPYATRRQDVEDIRSGARFVAETIGEQAPMLATTLAGAALGSVILPGAGTLLGAGIGGLVGGLAINIPFFYGLNREAQKDSVEQGIKTEVSEGAAFLYSLPQAALDSFADRFLIGSGLGTGRFTEQAIRTGNILTRGVKGAGTGVITEVPTEIGQQVIERWQADQDITSDEAISQYIDVGLAAGILGGGVRGTSSIIKGDIRRQDYKIPDYGKDIAEEIKSDSVLIAEEEAKERARIAEEDRIAEIEAEEAEVQFEADQQVPGETSRLQEAIDKGADETSAAQSINVPKLPRSLAGAKPKYANFGIKFANDVDKALYIIQDPRKSGSHERYFEFLREVYPEKSDGELRAMGQNIKDSVAQLARSNITDSNGDIILEAISSFVGQTRVPAITPSTPTGATPREDLLSAIKENFINRHSPNVGTVEAVNNSGADGPRLTNRLLSGLPEDKFYGWELPWGRLDKIVYHVQDRIIALKQYEDAANKIRAEKVEMENLNREKRGESPLTLREMKELNWEPITELKSAYYGEERTHGMIEERVRLFESDELTPLAERVTGLNKKFSDLTVDSLDEFLILRHAIERNNRVSLRTKNNPELLGIPSNDSGAGTIGIIDSSGNITEQELTNDFVKNKMESEYKMTWDDSKGIWTGGNQKARLLQSLSRDVDKIIKKSMDLRVENGLITEGDANIISNTFKYYVPLKGHKDISDDMSDVYNGGEGGGSKLTVVGSLKKLGRGRQTEAATPLGTIIEDRLNSTQRGIINKEFSENLVHLAETNPNNKAWEVIRENDPRYKQVLASRYQYVGDSPDLQGTSLSKEEYALTSNKNDYIQQMQIRAETPSSIDATRGKLIGAKIDGEQVYIDIKDRRLRNALLNFTPEQMNIAVRSLGTVNRFLSVINTSLNPAFVLSNFVRDIQTGLWNVIAEQTMPGGRARNHKLVRSIIKNTVPSVRTFYRGLGGGKKFNEKTGKFESKLTEKQQKDYDDYIQSGAKAGWFHSKPAAEKITDFNNLAKMSSGTFEGNLRERRRVISNIVENINSAVENGVRFATFVRARDESISMRTEQAIKEKGGDLNSQEISEIEKESLAKATSIAKNLTINFNRRGQSGVLLNSLYLFFNASVQGTANFLRGFVGPNPSRVKQAAGAGMVGLAYTISMLNEAASDEDENGRSFYSNIPPFEKERNIIIMKNLLDPSKPGDEYYKILLPYGYNVFHVFGTALEEILSGTMDLGEGTSLFTGALLGSFAPISLGTDFKSLTTAVFPTPTRPALELLANRNFWGAPIYKENIPFGPQLPASQLAFRSTPEGYRVISEFLNLLGGGNPSEPGSILGITTDISPDVLQHFGEFALGAAGGTGIRSFKLFDNWANNQEVEVRDIPFWRRLEGETGIFRSQRDFFERRDDITRKVTEHKRLADTRDFDASSEYFAENKAYILMAEALKNADTDLRNLNASLKQLRENQDRSSSASIAYQERSGDIEDRIDDVYNRFNKNFEAELEKWEQDQQQ